MKIKFWTIILFALIVVDSIFTVYIGFDRNPYILWQMETFDWSLKQAMVARIFYLIPFLLVLNWKDWGRFTFFAYIGIYAISAFMSFI